MRTATVKVISDGSTHGTRVIVVDDKGREHWLHGVTAVASSYGLHDIPHATIEVDCLAAWPKHKAKRPGVEIRPTTR